METNLKKIKRLARQREDENWEFRAFLKGYDMPVEEWDEIVHELYQQAASAIDCTTCANCCKEAQPVLPREDIERFSKGVGISTVQFKEQYLVEDDDLEGFTFKKKPCPFLKEKLCSHYACRPEDCRSYPHLHKKDFVFRLMEVVENYSVCPIVFNVYEALKKRLWHHARHRRY